MHTASPGRISACVATLALVAASTLATGPVHASNERGTGYQGGAGAADPLDLTVTATVDSTGMMTIVPSGPVFTTGGSCSYTVDWPLGTDLNGTHVQTLDTTVAPSADGSCPTWTLRLPADEFAGGHIEAQVHEVEDGGFSYDVSVSTESPASTGPVMSNLPIAYFDTGTLRTGVETTWAPEVVGGSDPIAACTFSHGEFAEDDSFIDGGVDYDHSPSCTPVTWTPAGTYIDAGQAWIVAGSGGHGLPGEAGGFDSAITVYVSVHPGPDPSESPSLEPTAPPSDGPTSGPSDAPAPSASPSPVATPVGCSAPTIALSEKAVVSGGRVHVVGCGFKANEPVTLTLDGDPSALGQFVAGEDGTFSATCTMPAGMYGQHTITATSETTTTAIPVAIVAGPSATPPPTNTDKEPGGSSSTTALALALLVALTGVLGATFRSSRSRSRTKL